MSLESLKEFYSQTIGQSFLSNVSSFGAVDVITTPLSVHGRLLWDPYLASILAEQVKYV
jgi:hypothetical protein